MSRYQLFLVGTFVVAWVVTAINPLDRDVWLLENVLVAIFIPIVFIAGRYFKLSDVSYTLITVFLLLHIAGTHWTYGEVPFGYWLQEVMGTDRNMYDRLVHFSFGLLLAYPIREVFIRVTGAKGVWGYYFPFDVVLSLSAIYEIMEWIAMLAVDRASGLAFLGAQGDVWDSTKDMASAGVGAFIAMLIVFAVNWKFNRKLGSEIRESLKIKNDEPMGEDGWRAMLRR